MPHSAAKGGRGAQHTVASAEAALSNANCKGPSGRADADWHRVHQQVFEPGSGRRRGGPQALPRPLIDQCRHALAGCSRDCWQPRFSADFPVVLAQSARPASALRHGPTPRSCRWLVEACSELPAHRAPAGRPRLTSAWCELRVDLSRAPVTLASSRRRRFHRPQTFHRHP